MGCTNQTQCETSAVYCAAGIKHNVTTTENDHHYTTGCTNGLGCTGETKCEVGNFCVSGIKTACVYGSFQTNTGQNTCTACPGGERHASAATTAGQTLCSEACPDNTNGTIVWNTHTWNTNNTITTTGTADKLCSEKTVTCEAQHYWNGNDKKCTECGDDANFCPGNIIGGQDAGKFVVSRPEMVCTSSCDPSYDTDNLNSALPDRNLGRIPITAGQYATNCQTSAAAVTTGTGTTQTTTPAVCPTVTTQGLPCNCTGKANCNNHPHANNIGPTSNALNDGGGVTVATDPRTNTNNGFDDKRFTNAKYTGRGNGQAGNAGGKCPYEVTCSDGHSWNDTSGCTYCGGNAVSAGGTVTAALADRTSTSALDINNGAENCITCTSNYDDAQYRSNGTDGAQGI